MTPKGFFLRHGPFSVFEIAQRAEAETAPGVDTNRFLTDVRPLSEAGPEDVSFLDNRRYLSELEASSVGACLIKPALADKLPAHTIGLYTDRPYDALARVLFLFYPEAGQPLVYRGQGGPIHPEARIEDGASVEPGAIVGPHAQIGAGTVIAANAVVGYGVRVGRGGYIGPNASVTHALIGDRVVIHAGAAIGQDGFGFAMGSRGHVKVPQIGRVIIQDDVEIGAGTTIDRGALSDTVIGEGTKIDNLVQIGHNVRIGRHCVLAGQVGISGSTVLEDFVAMGGQAGCAGHIRIGAGAQVAAASGVAQSIPAGERWGGVPAKPMALWAREISLLKALAEMLKGNTLGRLKQFLG